MSQCCQPQCGMPFAFDSGVTIAFTEYWPRFQPPTWSAKLYLSFILTGEATTNIDATTSGTGFLFTLSDTLTAALAPGEYRYWMVVTDGTTTEVTRQGVTNILPNFATSLTPSLAQQQLSALNVTISRVMGGEFSSTNFNGQSMTEKDLAMLLREQVRLQAAVLREQQAINRLRGGPAAGRIHTVFGPVFNNGCWGYGPYPWNQCQ